MQGLNLELDIANTAIKASISSEPVSGLYAENFDYHFQNQALALTALEFKLLDKLISHPRQVFSREQLLLAAQNHQDAIYARNVDSHIKAIRNKLRAVSAPECIHTKRGFGYYYEST